MPAPLVRRPTSFPSGIVASINQRHPASKNLVFSGVAQGGNFRSVKDGLTGTATAANSNSPKAVLDGYLGQAMDAQTQSYTQLLPYIQGNVSTYGDVVTFAAIFRPNLKGYPYSAHNMFIGPSSGSTILSFAVGGGNPATYSSTCGYAGAALLGGLNVFDLVPTFLATSMKTTSGVSRVSDTVLVRLDNGQMYYSFGESASSSNFVTNFSPISVQIGKQSVNYIPNCFYAATMCSYTKLSPSELLKWANDPWSFWFPQSASNYNVAGSAGVVNWSPTIYRSYGQAINMLG